jgi:hypothetical protein
MSSIGYMNYFSINECGLYRVKKPEPFGLEIQETMSLIAGWVKDRSMSTTIPWDPQSRKNKSKCYCKDIQINQDSGDILLVLWKSDTDSTGTLWGAEENGKTGQGKVVKYTNTYNGTNKVIWGRPCYYWIIPEFNAVVSIRFDHSVCDTELFVDYVKECINNRVEHPNRKKKHTDKGFVRISHEDDEKNLCSFRFDVSLMSMNTTNAELSKLASQITHIIRRETVVVNSKNERAEWLKFFENKVPFVSAKPKSKSRKIEVKFESKPTVQEIKDIIESYAKEGRKAKDWDNVGFVTESGSTTWVDKYRLTDIISSVNVPPNTTISASDLLTALTQSRARYVKPLQLEKQQDISANG